MAIMRIVPVAAGFAIIGMLSGCTQHPEFEGPPPAAGPVAPRPEPAAPPPAAITVYAPPKGGSAAVPVQRFAASQAEVIGSIRNEADAEHLEVVQPDGAQDVVIARYQGQAANYVDCGTYSIPPGAFSAPAAGTGLTRTIASTSGAEKVSQDTRLNARLVALVQPQGDDAALARVEGQYVLRRDLVFVDNAGRELRRTREFIDFGTDRPALFSDGVACVATGMLEQSILPEGTVGFGS